MIFVPTEKERTVTGMAEYIEREAAIAVADYAVDEHPYDKDPEKPETFSPYNMGWHDACDYIRDKLEDLPAADVAEARHGWWIASHDEFCACSICKYPVYVGWNQTNYCPNCGAKMDKEEE